MHGEKNEISPSIVETPKFLKEMKSVSASNCNCLPDCQSTDLTYSVTSNNFMWIENSIYQNSISIPRILCLQLSFQGMWFTKLELEPPLHPGKRSPAQTLARWGALKRTIIEVFLQAISKSELKVQCNDFKFCFEGEEDLWEAVHVQLNSRLHFKPFKSHEEETPGWADCQLSRKIISRY